MALSEERKEEILEEEVVRRSVRDPGIAALLSFLFNGLGQIYNGEISKGIKIMSFSVLTMTAVVTVGIYLFILLWDNIPSIANLWLGLGLLAVSVLAVAMVGLYSIYDAFKAARIKNRGRQELA